MKRRRPSVRADRPPDVRAKITGRRAAGLVAFAMLVGAGVYLLPSTFGTKSQSLLSQAEVALSRGDFQAAQRLADLVLCETPRSTQALVVAGYAAAGQQQTDAALGYFDRVPEDGRADALGAIEVCGDQAFQLGRVAAAEVYFRRVLQDDPSHVEKRERLIYLLMLESRTWEGQKLILPLLKAGHVASNHLIVVGSTKTQLADVSSFSAACLAAVPEDPLPRLHEARAVWLGPEPQQAEQLLRQIVAAHPEIIEAQAMLGRIFAEAESATEFLEWHKQLPASAEEHPEIWFDRGLWAKAQAQLAGAARCFWEAATRNPNHLGANYQLAQVLTALGKGTPAKPFAERANQLTQLDLLIDRLKDELEPETIRQTVELLEALGRPWEATGWCQLALEQAPQLRWAAAAQLRLRKCLPECPTYTLEAYNLGRQIDLSSYALPAWRRAEARPDQPLATRAGQSQVTFIDSAAAAGIDFTYFNGGISERFESVFEFNGGGVAALDYDGDGWPDLYFTQGGPPPPQQTPHAYIDRLFRNLQNGRFEDATAAAGLGDKAFGQGVTVGDFDNDGFPDLYVGNVGPNRFYHNNGDGTFSDVTAVTGTAGDAWTSSCLLADLNGDTLPDLYVVNYLGGSKIYTRTCEKDQPVRCAPLDYPAEQHRLYMNLGDGRFEDVTERCGIVAPDGRGLGIVAADLDDSGRLSLFVSNDMSANFFFKNQTATRGGPLAFSECALLNGLAFDADGASQAAMGIAIGDANEDGLLDLFVTTFYRQAKALYIQQPDRSFREESRHANLREAGFFMLGWGAQFIDGELDGHPDLIVTNGHVHDPRDPNIPYQMPPQYFRNEGQGRFVELPAAVLGKYFQGKYHGRALARLDWNRDGLEDVCISNMNAPAALLTNRTAEHGHFLGVRLIGVTGDRDAIGARLRLTAGGHTWVRQLTAGDGFHATNQRQLTFGLGTADRVDKLEITWPSGRTQGFGNLPADREILLIEGRAEAFPMSGGIATR